MNVEFEFYKTFYSPVSLYRNKPKLLIAEQMTEGVLLAARQFRKSSRTFTNKTLNFQKSNQSERKVNFIHTRKRFITSSG